MSGYKTFAVAGVGNIGKHIIEALLEKQASGSVASITLLTRSEGRHKDLAEKGVRVITVDYTSPSSLESALSGIDVLISTINLLAVGVQDALAVSAKAAGVKLFVPSEFGGDTENATDPFFISKTASKRKLKEELHLPYASFYTGRFTDQQFAPQAAQMLGFDFVNNKATIPGSGDAEISFTTRDDVGRFVAHALTALPKEKIEWRVFRIEGDRTTLNKVANDWQTHTGKKLTISHRPRSELETDFAKKPNDLVSFLLLEFDKGLVVGKPEELANGDFPDWNPTKVIDVLIKFYGQ